MCTRMQCSPVTLAARCLLIFLCWVCLCSAAVGAVRRSSLVVSRGSVGGARLHECAMLGQDHGMHDALNLGLLPVCKATSYNLEVCRQGPTRRKCTKGLVSGPAEDLLPVSEVETGVNVRPAGFSRRQVVGHSPDKYQEVCWWCCDSLWPP